MFCASLLAGRPFWQMPYGAQPHRDEGCFASAIEMRWTGIMSVSSLKNHWSSYCSLLLFRFELRSLPWILLADITRFRTRNLNWIERSRLFCYSVINLLIAFSCKSFYILSYQLLFVKHFFILFFVSFFQKQKTVLLLSEATVIFYHIFLICQALFLFSFVFFPKKQKRIRRRRDLNPRTAWTVYTLSRGASSATWVLLHMPKYNKIFNSLCSNRTALYYISKSPLQCQAVISNLLSFFRTFSFFGIIPLFALNILP